MYTSRLLFMDKHKQESNMKRNQQGMALLGTFLIVLIIAAVGFAGYKVYKSKKDDNAKVPKTSNTSQEQMQWQKGGYAVKGKYADASVVQVSDNKWRLYYATQPEVPGNNLEV